LTREKDDEMTTTPSRLLFALLSSDAYRTEALARITRALDEAGGNVRAAHEALGVPATTFSGWRRKWPELEDVTNLVTCCGHCNSARGNRPLRTWCRAVAEYTGQDAVAIERRVRAPARRALPREAARALIAERA
jgi:hypothetical protein